MSDKYERQAEQKRHFKAWVVSSITPLGNEKRKNIPYGEKFTIDGKDYHVPKSTVPECYKVEGIHKDWEEEE